MAGALGRRGRRQGHCRPGGGGPQGKISPREKRGRESIKSTPDPWYVGFVDKRTTPDCQLQK